MLSTRKQTGFSLMELMIAIVIVAIIASVALPSYQDSVRRANRAAMQEFMANISSRQRQNLLDVREYVTAASSLDAIKALGFPNGLPDRLDNATTDDTSDDLYTVTLAVDNGVAPPTFLITSVPAGSQALGGEPTLTLNHVGAKTPADKW